jgi:hypothetical protein
MASISCRVPQGKWPQSQDAPVRPGWLSDSTLAPTARIFVLAPQWAKWARGALSSRAMSVQWFPSISRRTACRIESILSVRVRRGPKLTSLVVNVRALHVALPTQICRVTFAWDLRRIRRGSLPWHRFAAMTCSGILNIFSAVISLVYNGLSHYKIVPGLDNSSIKH